MAPKGETAKKKPAAKTKGSTTAKKDTVRNPVVLPVYIPIYLLEEKICCYQERNQTRESI